MIGDWQFWVVSGAALLAACVVVRPLLPRLGGAKRSADGCPNCPSGSAASSAGKPKRAALTVDGKRV